MRRETGRSWHMGCEGDVGVGRYLMSLVSAASSALAPCACVVRVCSVVLMAWLVRVKASDTSDAWRSHAAYTHKEEERG